MKPCSSATPCPCGRSQPSGQALSYGACCGQWLETDRAAPDAQSLMRSRYCAFVLERAAYLRATWSAAHRPVELEFEPGVKWLGLDVRRVQQLDSEHAEVEFVARQKPARGAAVRLHERSRFLREAGRWFYVDGDAL